MEIPNALHTKDEIVAHFPNLPILEIWHTNKYWQLSYDDVLDMFNKDEITLLQWDAYRAIWRNSIPRLSGTAINFEF